MARRLIRTFPVSCFLCPVSGFLFLACSSAPPRAGTGTATGRGAPSGLAVTRDLASGVLAYAVAVTPADRVASVELAEQFELVHRDPATGRARRRIALGPPEWDIPALAVDAAGTAWIASLDGTVRAYDLRTGRERHRFHLGAGATAVAAGGAFVATGSATGVVCLRRRADGALLHCVAAHREAVAALDFDRSAARLVSAARDGTAILWAIPSLRIAGRRAGRQPLADATFAPDGGTVALAAGTGITLWTGAAERPCGAHRANATTVAWLPGGAALLSGSQDRTVRLWIAGATGCVEVAQLTGFAHQVRDVAVAAGGRWAAVAAWAPDLVSRATAVLTLLYGGGR